MKVTFIIICLGSLPAQATVGNNSGTERCVSTLPVADLDANKHSSSSSNGIKDDLQPELRDHVQQLQTNECVHEAESADISAIQSNTRSVTLSNVHSGNLQSNFCSGNSTYLESQGQDNEVFSYDGDGNNTDNLPENVEHETNVEQEPVLHHNDDKRNSISVTNKEKNPVTVSESDDDDDDNQPSFMCNAANSTILGSAAGTYHTYRCT